MSMTLYDLSSSTANIVAIDEPESHLHPAGQRALSRLLNNGSNQKFLSTHSAFIVQNFDPECVIAFGPEGDIRQLTSGQLSKETVLLAHWWTGQKLEPLTARYTLMVEGPADRIVLNAACSAVGYDLDKLGVSILELGGAGNFKAAYNLFGPKGFKVGIIGLVDEDHESKWSSWSDIPMVELENNNIFVCRKDLEDEYITALGAPVARQIFISSGLFATNEVANLTTAEQSVDGVANWARHKNIKIRAAMAVQESISETVVSSMPAISGLTKLLAST
jgi:putative ATP-dependent endonuclease of the OLD family